jgi:hypothetical protein
VKRLSSKVLLFAVIAVLALSMVLAVISLFPGSSTPFTLSGTFTLSPNETYTEGLGSLRGGENVTLWVQSPTTFLKEFSIISPTITDYVVTSNDCTYSIVTDSNIVYNFTASANYYEAVFVSESPKAGIIDFYAAVQEPKGSNSLKQQTTPGQGASAQESNVTLPYTWLNEASRILFFIALGLAMLLTLKTVLSEFANAKSAKFNIPSVSKKNCRILIVLLLISLVVWFLVVWFSLISPTPNPLAAFENWYTDNARDSYVSSLFLRDGFSVFSQPLSKLSNLDSSFYKYVTWPEMPQLYPLGSIFLFLPFGVLLQNGFNSGLIFKLEIVVFLVFASIGVYFFLKHFMQKNMALILKLIGVYIIYVSLVIFAADGEFDSVAFLFSLFAIFMFMTERYDYFFLLVAVSVFFKYQAGIFLFPLILVGLIRLFQKNKLNSLVRNKAVVSGAFFGFASLFTAYLSAPYFMTTSPQLIMNGINAFSPNTQISWSLQSFSILLTLTVTIAYAVYMLNKNSLLSLSSLFLLLPSFLLPYFQNWYIPFLFVYALIPQRKKELEATMLWLTFLIVVLAISGANYQPIPLIAQYMKGHLPYLPTPVPHLPQSLKGLITAAFA